MGRGCRVELSATTASGGARTVFGEDLLQGVSELLDGMARPKAVLRRSHGD